MTLLFWALVVTTLYCYVGYPCIALLSGLRKGQPAKRASDTDTLPSVSVMVAAYNEESAIQEKINTTFNSEYPVEKIQLVIASDGSTDRTAEIVKSNIHPKLSFIDLPRGGKNETLNAAVELAKNDLLIFTDADVTVEPRAINILASYFNDPSVGCVAGNFVYRGQSNEGEEFHWNLERWTKQRLSHTGSVTSASGGLFAIRKDLFTPIPPGVTDDFYISVQALKNKQRIIFCDEAVSFSEGVESTGLEFDRKVRTITAGLRGVWSMRTLCNPLKYGFEAIQLFTHKVARRLGAVPMLLQYLALSLLMAKSNFYTFLFVAQTLILLLALIGYLARDTGFGRLVIFSIPYFIVMILCSSLIALYNLCTAKRMDVWSPVRDN